MDRLGDWRLPSQTLRLGTWCFRTPASRSLYELDSAMQDLPQPVRYSSLLGSVTDAYLLAEVFARYRPQVVFHAARRLSMCHLSNEIPLRRWRTMWPAPPGWLKQR